MIVFQYETWKEKEGQFRTNRGSEEFCDGAVARRRAKYDEVVVGLVIFSQLIRRLAASLATEQTRPTLEQMIEFERHPLVHTASTCISISIQQIRHDYTHLVSLRIKHRVGRRFSLGTNPDIGLSLVLKPCWTEQGRAGLSRAVASSGVTTKNGAINASSIGPCTPGTLHISATAVPQLGGACKKPGLCLKKSFSYVCPEPVLVKRSFLYKTWTKSAVFSPRCTETHCSNPTGRRRQSLRKTPRCFSVSVCLFRACLGKSIVLVAIKWLQKGDFRAPVAIACGGS